MHNQLEPWYQGGTYRGWEQQVSQNSWVFFYTSTLIFFEFCQTRNSASHTYHRRPPSSLRQTCSCKEGINGYEGDGHQKKVQQPLGFTTPYSPLTKWRMASLWGLSQPQRQHNTWSLSKISRHSRHDGADSGLKTAMIRTFSTLLNLTMKSEFRLLWIQCLFWAV